MVQGVAPVGWERATAGGWASRPWVGRGSQSASWSTGSLRASHPWVGRGLHGRGGPGRHAVGWGCTERHWAVTDGPGCRAHGMGEDHSRGLSIPPVGWEGGHSGRRAEASRLFDARGQCVGPGHRAVG